MNNTLNKSFFVPAVYKRILQMNELPSSAKCIYFYLACCAGNKGECYPRQETVAEDLGISLRSVSSGIKLLETHGLVRANKRWKLNHYRIQQPNHTQKMAGDHTQESPGDIRKDEKRKEKKSALADASAEKKAKQQQTHLKDKIAFDFSFDPEITSKSNAITFIKREAEKIDYHMTLQEAANFLTIMGNGVTPNGRPIKNLGGLLRRWKEKQLPEVEEAAFEEEERLNAGQGVCFEYKDGTWTQTRGKR